MKQVKKLLKNFPSDGTNLIDYITIASTGNSTDFGDLPSGFGAAASGLSNNVRGLFAGGEVPGADSAQIKFVTISSTGNTADFGDLVEACQYTSGTSDSHGGLQA